MGRRFLTALGAYLALAMVAWWILEDELLWITWLALGLYALKSWLAVLKQRRDSQDSIGSDSD